MAKIDVKKLAKYISDGKSNRACAKLFGVSDAAVGQAKKRLNKSITIKAASKETAPVIVQKNLDTLGQLSKINESTNEILDLLMGWIRGDDKCIRILESQVKRFVWRNDEKGKDEELGVKEVKFKDPRELALKAAAEIRSQLKLQLELFQALYDIQAAEEFQREVLTEIGEVDKDVRDRIIHRLGKKRAVRQAICQP